jgi:hypothetical protein
VVPAGGRRPAPDASTRLGHPASPRRATAPRPAAYSPSLAAGGVPTWHIEDVVPGAHDRTDYCEHWRDRAASPRRAAGGEVAVGEHPDTLNAGHGISPRTSVGWLRPAAPVDAGAPQALAESRCAEQGVRERAAKPPADLGKHPGRGPSRPLTVPAISGFVEPLGVDASPEGAGFRKRGIWAGQGAAMLPGLVAAVRLAVRGAPGPGLVGRHCRRPAQAQSPQSPGPPSSASHEPSPRTVMRRCAVACVGSTHRIDPVPIFCQRSDVCCTRAQNGCHTSKPHGAPATNQRNPLLAVSGRTVGSPTATTL